MEDKNTCPLCDRPFGQAVEMHHLIPKSRGGKEMVALHPICHRQIHALFNEKELAKSFATIDTLRGHDEIKSFVNWLQGKPADFYRRTARKSGRKRR